MRKSTAVKTDRSPVQSAPASEVRPVAERPRAPVADTNEAMLIRAAKLADEYAAERSELKQREESLKPLAAELVGLMRATGRKSFDTCGRGIVSFLPATADGETLDAEKAIELLKAAGIAPPMKTRRGMPDRLELRAAR